MPDAAYAVVLIHNPVTEQTLCQPFTEECHADPLSFAHLFRESEEANGDFPGWLWVVTGNERAREIRRETIMAQVRGDA